MFSEQLQQLCVQIFAPQIEPILALFQVQIELLRGDAVELMQPTLSITPEALDAVDVVRTSDELVGPVVDPEVLRVADIDQAVVAAPPVRVNDDLRCHAATDNGLQRGLFAVRHDLGVDLAVTLQEPEDDGLAARPASALAAHAPSTEVGFIHLDLPCGERRLALALFGDAPSDFEKDHGDALARQAGQLRRISGRQIEREEAQELTKFLGGNSGTAIERVRSFHVSSLAPR